MKACKYLNVNVQNPGREVWGGEERGEGDPSLATEETIIKTKKKGKREQKREKKRKKKSEREREREREREGDQVSDKED